MKVQLLLSSVLSTLAIACSDPASPMMSPPDAAVDPASLVIGASSTRIPILQGTTETVEVTVTRLAAGGGDVVIEPVGLPDGVTFDPVTVPAGTTTATLTLHADAAAPHSLPTSVELRGTMGTHSGSTDVTITVYGPPGSLDTSFGGGKVVLPAGDSDDYAYAVAVQSDGKIVVGGRAAEHLGDFALIRLDRDGQLDPTFGDGGRVLTDFAGASETIYALAIQSDGKIVAAGTTTGATTGNDFAVARYLPSGELDATFGTGGKVVTALGDDADTAYALLIEADGKLLVGGDSNRGSNQTGLDFALVRYTQTGAVDTTFGTAGVVLTPIAANGGRDSISALAIQAVDGEDRIVAAGGEGDFTIVRYRANGALDTTFGSGGKVANLFGSTIGAARAIAVTPAGAIAVAGHSQHDIALAQLTDEGALDPFFGSAGKVITPVTATNWDEAQAIAIDTAGKLVVAGWAYDGASSAGNFVLARYLTDGTLDPSFAETGIVTTPVAAGTKPDQAMAIAIQSDDRVPTHRVIAAGFASASNSDFAVTRYWR